MIRNAEKMIESLGADFIDLKHTKILQPHRVSEEIIHNRLIYVYRGKVAVSSPDTKQVVGKTGDIIFISAGSSVDISYGHVDGNNVENAFYPTTLHYPVETIDHKRGEFNTEKHITTLNFHAEAHGAMDFFRFAELPPIVIKNDRMVGLLRNMFYELANPMLGSSKALDAITMYLVVELMRYMLSGDIASGNVSELLMTKIDALMHEKLSAIYDYVRENIQGDLSNETLGNLVGYSKEYVGQFFVRRTTINLQTYVQMFRLKKALQILRRNPKKKVEDVAKDVGYRDFSYFCKQFREFYGNSARQLRQKFIQKI